MESSLVIVKELGQEQEGVRWKLEYLWKDNEGSL